MIVSLEGSPLPPLELKAWGTALGSLVGASSMTPTYFWSAVQRGARRRGGIVHKWKGLRELVERNPILVSMELRSSVDAWCRGIESGPR